MTDDSQDPLPARVSEYVVDGNYDATPNEVLRDADLDEFWHEQAEHYLAVTRTRCSRTRRESTLTVFS
ncbi:MAG TPA: hypothetical protein VFJ06_12535 [Halococcus sp.]|nr:hypothetical protein [Halococcus sp.]